MQVESNESEENECVYQFLLNKYTEYIPKLTKSLLLDLFDNSKGVTTRQVQIFCKKYSIALYALDLELKVFHHYSPTKRSHKIPVLVYVVANKHMYPIVDETVRNSIFAIERTKSSKRFERRLANKKEIGETILDPEFKDIQSYSNCTIVYTLLTSLLDLVVYLYKHEKVIYSTDSFNGNITKLNYKNNVTIEINPDYQVSLIDTLELSIPFRNQSSIYLVNEAFDICKANDNVFSTFNSITHDIFFNYRKTPFEHTYFEPVDESRLTAIDIQKCHSSALSNNNKYSWSVFCIFDEVKPYSGMLKDGFYYIESTNYFPLRGNGWYSRGILEYCRKVSIQYSIKYEIIPSYKLKPDYFNSFVERIYSECTNPIALLDV